MKRVRVLHAIIQYRALGECVVGGMFREEIVGERTPATVRDWFRSLAKNLQSDNYEALGPLGK
jgi:hypothetical protein